MILETSCGVFVESLQSVYGDFRMVVSELSHMQVDRLISA